MIRFALLFAAVGIIAASPRIGNYIDYSEEEEDRPAINRYSYSSYNLTEECNKSQFIIDLTKHVLYCTTNDGSAASIDLDTKELVKLPLENVKGKCVDPKTHTVYMATPNGIYKINPNNLNTELIDNRKKDIIFMQYNSHNDKVYYTEAKVKGIFVLGGDDVPLPGSEKFEINEFVIDKINDIHIGTVDPYTLRIANNSDSAEWLDKKYSLANDAQGQTHFLYNGMIFKKFYDTGIVFLVGRIRNVDMYTDYVFDNEYGIVVRMQDTLYHLPEQSVF